MTRKLVALAGLSVILAVLPNSAAVPSGYSDSCTGLVVIGLDAADYGTSAVAGAATWSRSLQ
jgi:hypothetical protein